MTGRQYVFPRIEFKCDTQITRIIYKGELWEPASFYPIIQLYKEGIPILADYRLVESVYLNELTSFSQGDSGTVILTPRSPIEVDDDSILGLYLPLNSTNFLFEDNPLQSFDIFYDTTPQIKTFYQLIQSVRLQGLVPLITVETCK